MLRRNWQDLGIIFKINNRSLSTQSSTKTEVVLLHFGQPWTEYYAKDFLHKRALMFYNLPQLLHRAVSKELLSNERIRGCINSYGERPSLELQVDSLASKLEKQLDSLVPEHGPFKVSRLFHFDTTSFDQRFEELKEKRSERYIFLSLYPHYYCPDGGNIISQIAKHIETNTVPFVENNKNINSKRITQNSDYSFDISTIHRWNDHPVLSEIWAQRIKEELPKLDGVVFAVPRKFSYSRDNYDRVVWATCERVMTQLAHSVPWRFGYYNSWDSWDLPCRDSVGSQIKRFGQLADRKKIAVVPITEVFETFDTIYVLPKILENHKDTVFLSPGYNTEKVTQGFSEIVKNHLMGRPDRQLEVSCDHCIRKDCNDRSVFF